MSAMTAKPLASYSHEWIFLPQKMVPIAATKPASGNPSGMEIWVYRGEGQFALYEDEGQSMGYEEGRFATTRFAVSGGQVSGEGQGLSFRIEPAQGDLSSLPNERSYLIVFKDITDARSVEVRLNGEKIDVAVEQKPCCSVAVSGVRPTDSIAIELRELETLENPAFQERCVELLSKYQAGNSWKNFIYLRLRRARSPAEFRKKVSRLPISRIAKDALLENLEE